MPPNRTASQLYTAPAYNTGFLAITKCGSTFLKTLFWRLNFGALPQGDTDVHANDHLLPRGTELRYEEVAAAKTYFAVIRDPVSRFVSLYLDKFQEPLRPSRPTNVFCKLIGPEHGYSWTARTQEQHAANLHIAIAAIEFSLGAGNRHLRNPHWAHQHDRIDRFARPMNLAALTVEGLNAQLTALLSGSVPEIEKLISQTKRPNAAKTRMDMSVVDEDLRTKIRTLYARDTELWSELSVKWDQLSIHSIDPETIPRFGDQYQSEIP